ncbi:MAG: hypothetical protein MUE68_00405 [Bacteroidetes bacterium]|jgi:hypothetical protein|nr:hypothetical protein [Bacteroidota bacterium]
MSLYRALDLERLPIQYSVVHQPAPGVQIKEYQQNLQEMHRSVRAEAQAVTARWNEYRRDSAERAVQAIRGNLLQFLTTPLQSDVGEIKRVVTEQIDSTISTIVPHSTLGPLWSTEGKYDVDPLKTGPLKNATAGAKRLLSDLGFKFTKTAPPVYESTFLLDGGLNLDIIEHIVRDRVGIYASLHGRHIREASAMVFAAHNMVHRRGETGEPKGMEAVLLFSKGPIPYDQFRRGLIEALDAAWEGKPPAQVAVMQRKLGLGRGLEFQLRICASSRGGATDFMDRLLRASAGSEIGDILKSSALLMREILI